MAGHQGGGLQREGAAGEALAAASAARFTAPLPCMPQATTSPPCPTHHPPLISSSLDAMGVPVTTQAWRRQRDEATSAATLELLATSWASSSTTLHAGRQAGRQGQGVDGRGGRLRANHVEPHAGSYTSAEIAQNNQSMALERRMQTSDASKQVTRG